MSRYYLITGRKDTGGSYDRLEIEELQKNQKQFTLFILAYLVLQGRDPESVTGERYPIKVPPAASFPELAGIHGLPFAEWLGDRKNEADFNPNDSKDTHPVPSRFGGYCNHGSVVFPTWHRPYVMAIEQAIGDIATGIADEFAKKLEQEKSEANAWKQAAKELRFPFWDWAAKKVQTEGVPVVLTCDKVMIYLPQNRSIEVDNPLEFYGFKSIPDGFEDEVLDPSNPEATAYFKEWTRTFRYAPSTPTPNGSNTAKLNEKIKERAPQIRCQVSDLFTVGLKGTPSLVWDEFSNHTTESLRKMDYYNINSLEGIHDTMHDTIGGNGHMTDPNYAGFDPIFFLHHCNVDRLLAFWEYVYPEYYMGKGYPHGKKMYPFTQSRGTYNLVYNSQLVGDTPLAPFRTGDSQYWTSDKARFLDGKYYCYPEVAGVKIGKDITDKERIEARKKLQEYYGVDKPQPIQVGGNMTRLPYDFHVPAPQKIPKGYEVVKDFRRMVIVVQTPEFAFNGPYSIEMYFKNTSTGTEEYVGVVAVFARPDRSPCRGCISRREGGSIIRGIIPIPLNIIEGIITSLANTPNVADSEPNLEELIANELKENLNGKIVDRNGNEVGSAKGSIEVADEDSLSRNIVPDITLISSAAMRSNSHNGDGPIEWADWLNHGKVFKQDSSWKKA
ncbi:common central domain of tyrosinase-domain-containing protein [Rhodocollybia butyracea]|uniref:tyrosinase n=1 Tax=Rhodocollybia butyracea TaxID=206335 RepID=A0A9P5PKH0_9AGAR|nr:common central domain of tyrosinase-domain-containing protein [Rhodocollybia butyracea]